MDFFSIGLVLACASAGLGALWRMRGWFRRGAAIMGVNTAMGGVTPPYASILYLGMRIGKVEFSEIKIGRASCRERV